MAEAQNTTEVAKKRRKPQGPRQVKPIFLVIEYRDESGQPQKLDADRLTITPSKDTEELLKLVTGGGAEFKTVMNIVPPVATKASPAS
jgi:hypothetical protein